MADGGFFVGVDVAAVKDQLAVFDSSVGFGKLASAPAEGFDLAAEEDDAAFQLVGDKILVKRAAIGDARGEIVSGAVRHDGDIVVYSAGGGKVDTRLGAFKIRMNAAAVAKLADAQDSGSCVQKTWRFNSSQPHWSFPSFGVSRTIKNL